MHRAAAVKAAARLLPSVTPTTRTSRMGLRVSCAKHDAQPEPDLWMVVGLGNPGARYTHTRHNVGFMAVDAIAQAEGIDVSRLQSNAAVGRGRFCDKKVLLVKPLTFMNVSGESVGKLARYYEVRRQGGVRRRLLTES